MSRPRQGQRGPVLVKCEKLRCDSSTRSFKLIWSPYEFIAGKSRKSSPNLFFQINLILILWLSQWSTGYLNLANILSFLPQLHKPFINSSTWSWWVARCCGKRRNICCFFLLPERSFLSHSIPLKINTSCGCTASLPVQTALVHKPEEYSFYTLPQLCR